MFWLYSLKIRLGVLSGGLLDTQLEEIVAFAGQTDVGDWGLCWTDRCWRLWPVLDRQMLEIGACAGQTDVGDCGLC